MSSILQCIDCAQQYPIDEVRYTCDQCGGLLDVMHDLNSNNSISRELFDSRLGTFDKPYDSGVWRYKEMIYPDLDNEFIVSRPEGNTPLYPVNDLARWAGVGELFLKHEGMNPTGSFKDRGMTTGVTQARVLDMKRVACASTGNTSASLASYAAWANLSGIIFLQNKQIAVGKLAQGIAYGATCIQINADFDRNLELVRTISDHLGIYVLNSINPFRLEGQKSIMFEMIQQLRWHVPDWIVVPGGNLGNSSAFGKALFELHQAGLIDRLPRMAIIQAEGADPLYRYSRKGFNEFEPVKADTIATAIKIGNPVNLQKAIRTLEWTNGVVEEVTDQQIMDAKALIDRAGIGCEPASACSLAGVRKLHDAGVIRPTDTVVGILTGNIMKDPDATIAYHSNMLIDEDIVPNYANRLLQAEDDIEQIEALLLQNT